jgi:hypothetical protein
MNPFAVLNHKLSDPALTDKESSEDKEIGKPHIVMRMAFLFLTNLQNGSE